MIHTIIDLNNKGVRYLEAGDHERARIAFKEALERTTYLLNLKHEAEELVEMGADQEEAFASFPMCESRSNSLDEIEEPLYDGDDYSASTNSSRRDAIERVPISTSMTSDKQESGPFIYSHALLMSTECCANPVEQEFCHRESAVIMFNLALVHHWRGMHFGLTSLLPKALKLYEMSFSLIQNEAAFETEHIVLGLLNNMGQLNHELASYQEAARCFKELKEMLTAGASQVVDGPDVQGFLMNIMFLEAPNLAAAA
jgi:tetratricopeptide (TPR) repeat protein